MTFLWRPYPLGSFGGRVSFERGDMLDVLRGYDDDTFDSCVCDPPYHLTSITKRFGGANAAPAQFEIDGAYARAARGFMGKTWDGGDVAFRVETWAAVLRVLKPGAHLVAFAARKNSHRMVCAIEDAGFEIRDSLAWMYGTGKPPTKRDLKPAHEPICLARKPLSEDTVTLNLAKWGTGSIEIEDCRVDASTSDEGALGRWPATICHDGSPEVLACFPDSAGQLARARTDGAPQGNKIYGAFNHATKNPEPRNDVGSAARFFYAAKASSHERAGSKHATVKPLSLMRYLTRLVTRPGGLVLDPFAGSGTTGEAAALEGMRAHLIDMEHDTLGDLARREMRCRGFEVDDPTEGAD